jgi:hypothetical protein
MPRTGQRAEEDQLKLLYHRSRDARRAGELNREVAERPERNERTRRSRADDEHPSKLRSTTARVAASTQSLRHTEGQEQNFNGDILADRIKHEVSAKHIVSAERPPRL